MNVSKQWLVGAALFAGGLTLAGESHAAIIGQWDFDGDLLATVGTDGVAGGTFSASYDTASNGEQYIDINDAAGGTSWLDLTATATAGINYTLIYDMNMDNVLQSGFGIVTLLNASVNGGNPGSDDQDFYIRTNGTWVGGGQEGSAGLVTEGWHRLVFTRNGGDISFYQDGTLLGTATPRTGRGDVLGTLSTFADADAVENRGALVNQIVLHDTALTAQQVAALGGSSIPEPGSLFLLVLASTSLLHRRRQPLGG